MVIQRAESPPDITTHGLLAIQEQENRAKLGFPAP